MWQIWLMRPYVHRAYAEEAFHADTLKKAQMLLKEKFPSVEVLLGFTAVADDDTVVIRKVS